MVLKVTFGPPKTGSFVIHSLHQNTVPYESKQKHQDERAYQSQRTSFVIHGKGLYRKWLGCVHQKTNAQRPTLQFSRLPLNVERWTLKFSYPLDTPSHHPTFSFACASRFSS